MLRHSYSDELSSALASQFLTGGFDANRCTARLPWRAQGAGAMNAQSVRDCDSTDLIIRRMGRILAADADASFGATDVGQRLECEAGGLRHEVSRGSSARRSRGLSYGASHFDGSCRHHDRGGRNSRVGPDLHACLGGGRCRWRGSLLERRGGGRRRAGRGAVEQWSRCWWGRRNGPGRCGRSWNGGFGWGCRWWRRSQRYDCGSDRRSGWYWR